MNIVISDAGPLIHLTEIGCLSLLGIFDTLHIPDTVWLETVGHKRVSEIELSKLKICRHTLSLPEVTTFIAQHSLQNLQAGECECLYLGHLKNISLLLTDDLAVRNISPQLGITPIGSLGVIVRCCHRGLIPISQAECHIKALYDISSLFVTQAIVELAIAQIQTHS